MADDVRHRLRTTFEDVPELYDRARPTYPPAVFDDLVELGGLRPGARVLEIGCGTGLATVPLAERGLDVVCVELGSALAEVARRKLAPFPNVEVVTAAFETWGPAEAAFDAVVAFTAFHWLDPEVRYAKPAALLRPGGVLGVVDVRHVQLEGGDPFWTEVQEDYDAVVPDPGNRPPPPPDEVPHFGDEISASGLFVNVGLRRHVWSVTYTSEEYLAVLRTYSGHRVLPDGKREELLGRIRRRVEARTDPRVTKEYLATLNVAARLP